MEIHKGHGKVLNLKVYIAFDPEGFIKGVFLYKNVAETVSDTVEEWNVS